MPIAGIEVVIITAAIASADPPRERHIMMPWRTVAECQSEAPRFVENEERRLIGKGSPAKITVKCPDS